MTQRQAREQEYRIREDENILGAPQMKEGRETSGLPDVPRPLSSPPDDDLTLPSERRNPAGLDVADIGDLAVLQISIFQ
jgi:hypothetical protein